MSVRAVNGPTAGSSRPCADDWLPASRWLACTRSRGWPGWSGKPRSPKSWSRCGSVGGEPPKNITAWVGRLELHCARLLHTRSGDREWSDLRFRRTFGVRSCPLLSAVHLSAADSGRTEERFRFRAVADASGVHSPIRTRSPGLSNADTAGQSPWRIWRGLVARRQSTYVGSFVTFSER
jgi:hypothetical protein